MLSYLVYWMQARLWYKPLSFSHLNGNNLVLKPLDCQMKSTEVCIKTRLSPVALPFKGQISLLTMIVDNRLILKYNIFICIEKKCCCDSVLLVSALLEPEQDVDFEDQCKICMDAGIDCVLLECGHMVTCTKCSKQITDCPICRQHISRIVHVFKA